MLLSATVQNVTPAVLLRMQETWNSLSCLLMESWTEMIVREGCIAGSYMFYVPMHACTFGMSTYPKGGDMSKASCHSHHAALPGM